MVMIYIGVDDNGKNDAGRVKVYLPSARTFLWISCRNSRREIIPSYSEYRLLIQQPPSHKQAAIKSKSIRKYFNPIDLVISPLREYYSQHVFRDACSVQSSATWMRIMHVALAAPIRPTPFIECLRGVTVVAKWDCSCQQRMRAPTINGSLGVEWEERLDCVRTPHIKTHCTVPLLIRAIRVCGIHFATLQVNFRVFHTP